ncbi:hypothetical protein WR25_03651 [Diploscapter pachys]|uniref:Amino acid transporter transmembrane domain-containing protein n=1 Tax=Diploscapter pachys TaxID=2018661 RepID=A0A2A2KMR6_9BILA|nr:hypothetical protein WR25_03651 [Diploscapter pachys]
MGIAIYPFSMLRSPRHFWQIAVFAAGSSSLAAVLLLIGAIHDAPVCSQDVPHRGYNFHEACMAYGTLLFAYGGHSIFPTIQMDMKKPVHFAKSVIVGFTIVTIYYISVSLTSVLIYGNSIGDIIIPSIQLSWVQHIVNVMIAIHVVTTIVIVFSPLAQQVEDLFKIPHTCGVVGGLVAMIASIIRLADSTMGVPCYVQYFRGGLEFHSSDLGIVNCCGSYHNITVSGRDPVGYCSAYRPH